MIVPLKDFALGGGSSIPSPFCLRRHKIAYNVMHRWGICERSAEGNVRYYIVYSSNDEPLSKLLPPTLLIGYPYKDSHNWTKYHSFLITVTFPRGPESLLFTERWFLLRVAMRSDASVQRSIQRNRPLMIDQKFNLFCQVFWLCKYRIVQH